ncbi:hypothetical protein [Lysobacter enzymogenes]|uniref:hypothetical protein n=1 Tax=Lysobacter enzymogenes TaxID=69 RepID=UPI0037484FED
MAIWNKSSIGPEGPPTRADGPAIGPGSCGRAFRPDAFGSARHATANENGRQRRPFPHPAEAGGIDQRPPSAAFRSAISLVGPAPDAGRPRGSTADT